MANLPNNTSKSRIIRGLTPSLTWLSDLLAFFSVEAIKIPSDYRDKVIVSKEALEEDVSGLVNTMLDFAIKCSLTSFRIESDNANLSEILNNWLDNINEELRGKSPTGLKALHKEYGRERWKGSSNILLRTFWEKKDDLILPTTLFFVNGEDIKSAYKDPKVVRLGDLVYSIRVDDDPKKDITLPTDENELIFVQQPYDSWGVREPTPFLIRRGLYRNMKFIELVSSKGETVVNSALEYLMAIKKGTERMTLEGRGELTYSEADLTKVKENLDKIVRERKSEGGLPSYVTNFDTAIEHIIPEYEKILSDTLYSPIERKILAGLGLVDIVEGTASTRRESILNPKPFVAEVEQNIEDFAAILKDIVEIIKDKNDNSHRKWMNAKIKVSYAPVKDFMTNDVKTLLRSLYDRGRISSRTFVEVVGDLDYDLEVLRRKEEKKKGEEKVMYPPVVTNQEQYPDGNPATPSSPNPTKNEEKLPDRNNPVEKKNFKSASKTKGGNSREEA